MGRGQKICPKCSTPTGPRAYNCVCGHSYNINVGASKLEKKKLGIKTNWKELQPGDFIKVLSGTGPYWPFKNGTTECMGYHGKFRVKFIDKDGIHAYPADKKNSGHCYIYMGPKKKSKVGLVDCPHKIRKLTTKPTITNVSMAG